MKRLIFYAFVALLVCSCKPTEQNYKSAYDAAMKKKAQQSIGADGSVIELEDLSGPSQQIIGNDTILITHEGVKAVEPSPAPGEGKIGVAISKFGMITNARMQASDLRSKEPDIFVAVDGDGNHYVVVARCNSLPDAVEIVNGFKKRHPDYPFIGLPGSPVTVTIHE